MKKEKIMKNRKKLLCCLLLLCVAVGFNFIYASSDTAYDIYQYTIDATVMKSGDLHVVENICFDFHANANGIFRDILYRYNYDTQKDSMKPTSSRYQASNISNISVTEFDEDGTSQTGYSMIKESSAQNGMSNVFSVTKVTNDGYIDRIKIYIPSSSGTRKYMRIEYDIEDVAVLYQNSGEIYWNFVGNRWDCNIYNLKVNIDFESSYQGEEIKFYPHGYTEITNITNQDGKLSFFVEDLKRQTAVDARVVFPSGYLNDNIFKKIAKPYDTKELMKIENSMTFGKTRHQITPVVNTVIGILAVIFLLIVGNKSSQIAWKGKKKKAEYYRDILNGLSLEEYAKIYGSSLTNSNLTMAMILDLKERNVIEMRAEKKLKKSWDGIEYDYYLTIKETFSPDLVTEFEMLLLNYLFNQKATAGYFGFEETTIELNERLKELSKNYTQSRSFYNACTSYDGKIGKKLHQTADKQLKKFTLIGTIILVALLVINLMIISPATMDLKLNHLMTSMVLSFVYFAIAFSLANVKPLKEEYCETYNQLKGLEKYLKEYSLLKDRYPIEIELWNKYLVFATLFGISKKVAKEFKEELLNRGYDDDYIYVNYPIIGMSHYVAHYSSSFASSTGSSSSGGYSGGGSGGGGRRRWRRRLLLKDEKVCSLMNFL